MSFRVEGCIPRSQSISFSECVLDDSEVIPILIQEYLNLRVTQVFLVWQEFIRGISCFTVPVLMRERWPNCWVRGPTMEAGWREMGWSIPGVRTEP